MVHAYNCSHSNATGFSPFYLMFRRQPMLPIDVQFGVRTPDIVAFHITWLYPEAPEKIKLGI